MSLINDALKKAQNRQGTPAPATPGTPGPAQVPGQSSGQKKTLARGFFVGALATLLVVAASVAGTVLLLKKDEPPPAKPAPAPAAAVISPAPPSPAPIQPVSAPVTPAVTTVVAATTPAADTSPPPRAPMAPVPPVQPPQTPPASTTPSPAEPPAPAIRLGTRIQAVVDRLRVTSIRISDTGNKAILNDRLFRVNDLVEPALGLRLTDIQPHLLTFTDETGATYLRRF
jgi:hypothetical protein